MNLSESNLKQTLENLSSSSSRSIYNALVHIRTKVIKSKQALNQVLSLGLVAKLLTILQNADTSDTKPKIADIALSILGNLCMEAGPRNDVLSCQGIESITVHLLESKVESIQNRSCRTLANMALSPSACPKILSCDVAARIVSLLSDTKSKECQLTYCRAFRLFGRCRVTQRIIVGAGAILPIAKLIKHEDKDLADCSLRTIAELVKLGVCSSLARQMIGANVLDKLISLVDSENATDSNSALTTLYNLNNQPDVRAAIGAAGGITLFIRLLKDEGNQMNVNYISVMNALCLSGKEAVNRVKIREQGGLEVFLNALSNSRYAQVHDRIISGLVCFLYDDASIDALLENKLVDTLLVHLQRCGNFTSSVEVLTFPEQTLLRSTAGSSFSHKDEQMLHSKHKINLVPNEKAVEKPVQQSSSIEEMEETMKSSSVPSQEDPCCSNRQHTFSIDSPTYEVTSEWNLDSYGQQTCKQSFSHEDICQSLSPSPPLSPLSNDTYYSPSSLSPSYSLPRSPGSPSESPSDMDQEYPPVLSLPHSSSNLSLDDSRERMMVQACYSSSEEDTVEFVEASEQDISKTDQKDIIDDTCDLEEKVQTSGKRPLSVRSPSYKLVESSCKRTKTDSKQTDHMKTTVNNILILLSRISVKTNPTAHLVTSSVMSSMLDYLFYVQQPHSRCVRTMSRLFKNPHCLQSCLQICVPVLIYKKIILDSEGIDKESYENFNQRKSTRTRSNSCISESSEDSFCGGHLTNLDNSFPGSSAKDNALDFANGPLASPSSPRSEADICFKVGQSPMPGNIAELAVVDVGQSGLRLLKDLSFTAESNYGRGTISHVLLRRPYHERLQCTISLLYLCWGSVMQQQYLIKFKILDTVVDLLKDELDSPGPVFMAVVSGLSFLCKLNNIPMKLKHDKAAKLLKPLEDRTCCDHCTYNDFEPDVFFTVDGETVGANREKLVRSSAMFFAMLEGHYSESGQSKIIIQDTSCEALEYILHFLQGCVLTCPVLRKIESSPQEVTAEFVLEVMTLADRFLLTELVQHLKLVISSDYLYAESCSSVFEYASFHEFSDLATDCVKMILTKPISLSEKSELFVRMMSSNVADEFVETLKDILKGGFN